MNSKILFFSFTLFFNLVTALYSSDLCIAVTNPALALITHDIAGPGIKINDIFGESVRDPHLINLHPSELIELSNANIVVCTNSLADKLKLKIKELVYINSTQDSCPCAHNHSHHHHESINHEWLSFELSSQLAEKIKNSLCKLDPENVINYEKNLQQFKDKLSFLRNKYQDKKIQKQSIIYHNSFFHLEKELNVTFGPVLLTCEESSFSPRNFDNLIKNQSDYEFLIIEKTINPAIVNRLQKQFFIPLKLVDATASNYYPSYVDFVEYILDSLSN